MKLPKYEIALRMVNAPTHKYLSSCILYKSGCVLAITIAMGLSAVEASDYSYAGTQKSQSWDRQSSGDDYATRWDRGTKPWIREPSSSGQSEVGSFGSGFAPNYGDHGGKEPYSVNRQDWQTEQRSSYLSNPWRSADEYRDRHYAPALAHDEQSGRTEQKSEQWVSGRQRNPWEKTEKPHKFDPWMKPQPSTDHRNNRNRWSEGTAWPQGNKRGNSFGAVGDTEPRWRDWSQPSVSGSYNSYPSSSGYGSSAVQENHRKDGSWYSSEFYAPDSLQYQKRWERDQESFRESNPWRGRHNRIDSSQNRQRSNSVSNMQNIPPVDAIQPGYSEYPGYPRYPEHYVPHFDGAWGNGPGYGSSYYPGYNHYANPLNSPMLGDSQWFLF